MIKLHVSGELGGRIIQLEMDDYEYFFNNPLLTGKNPDETRLGENGSWLNFGGEKIWPAPQGWDSPEQWSGPPDPVLDSGIYTVSRVYTSEKGNSLTVTSPADPRTGLQITKEVFLEKKRSVTVVNATFSNKTKLPVRWSVWPVLQMNTHGSEDERYRVICPVNPESKFETGFKVMHGLANNPQYKQDTFGNLVINYRYLAGKVGLDSSAGWMAFLDSKTGKVLALAFDYEKNGHYPENTSIQIWTQGRGTIFSRNKIVEYQNNRKLNPPYMEMELLSPLKKINPEESIHFKYKMLCSTITPFHDSIYSVNEMGIIASPLTLKSKEDSTIINAKYGVFNEGKIKIFLSRVSRDKDEKANVLYEKKVSPYEGTDINISVKSEVLFNKKTSLAIAVYDLDDRFLGEIEQIKLIF